mgnify:CR=1 FL=1
MSVSIVGAAFLAACSDDANPQYKDAKSTPMTFVVKHPSQTRATETDFEIGDRIGLYVADTEKPMELGGNLANNDALTYDGDKWTSLRPLYWDDGTFNVYRKNIDGTGKKRLTEFKRNPVRFLTSSKSDDLCFAYDGEIYVMKNGQSAPSKVKISIVSDTEGDRLHRQIVSSGATEMAVSPNGKEVAFVMHGDVYVTNVEYKTTRQITDTPEQERNVQFSPDGKALVYAAERGGLGQIYQTKIRNKAESQFAYATELDEERLIQTDRTSQQPKYSPDGKKVAYLEDRGTIRTIDLKTKEIKTCLDGKYMYSYSDGDVDFDWSPDSKWFVCTYIGIGGWNNTDIALVSASGNGEIHNLTNSGYSESNAKWVLGGKALLFQSDRAGYRSWLGVPFYSLTT